jgi:nucleoid-associated protein YgaU
VKATASSINATNGTLQQAGRDPFADVPAPKTVHSGPSPVFSTVSDGPTVPKAPEGNLKPADRIHVVHQGDSLDRLAKRYLGDEARALEIFDANRDVLDNPHLLPLGAELRMPSAGVAGED